MSGFDRGRQSPATIETANSGPAWGAVRPNWGTMGDRDARLFFWDTDPFGLAVATARPRCAWIGPQAGDRMTDQINLIENKRRHCPATRLRPMRPDQRVND
jgi:hypothetical protein